MIDFTTWMHRVMGTQINFPGGIGGECVDLTNDYLAEAWGLAPVRLNATNWRVAVMPPEIAWENNGPTNYPPQGAVIVWRGAFAPAGIGPLGHVAVVILANSSVIWSMDQNWAGERTARPIWHDYGGVAGWWKRIRPLPNVMSTPAGGAAQLSPQQPPLIPKRRGVFHRGGAVIHRGERPSP